MQLLTVDSSVGVGKHRTLLYPYLSLLRLLTVDSSAGVVGALQSAEKSLDEGHFGLFDAAWNMPFEATDMVSTHAVAIVPAALLGLCCGILGALFTYINVKVARLRKRFIGSNKIRQMAEPCAIMFVIATVTNRPHEPRVVNAIRFTGNNRKIVSTYEPKIMLTNSPA
eukprot:1195821-Prorocentrum_minimum.AAC.3